MEQQYSADICFWNWCLNNLLPEEMFYHEDSFFPHKLKSKNYKSLLGKQNLKYGNKINN